MEGFLKCSYLYITTTFWILHSAGRNLPYQLVGINRVQVECRQHRGLFALLLTHCPHKYDSSCGKQPLVSPTAHFISHFSLPMLIYLPTFPLTDCFSAILADIFVWKNKTQNAPCDDLPLAFSEKKKKNPYSYSSNLGDNTVRLLRKNWGQVTGTLLQVLEPKKQTRDIFGSLTEKPDGIAAQWLALHCSGINK